MACGTSVRNKREQDTALGAEDGASEEQVVLEWRQLDCVLVDKKRWSQGYPEEPAGLRAAGTVRQGGCCLFRLSCYFRKLPLARIAFCQTFCRMLAYVCVCASEREGFANFDNGNGWPTFKGSLRWRHASP